MKRVLVLMLMLVLVLGAVSFGQDTDMGEMVDAKVELNGVLLNDPELKPFILEGTTMVPVRWVAENLGANVGWEQDSMSVLVDSDFDNLDIKPVKNSDTINGNTILNLYVNNKSLGMDAIVPPILVGNTSYVPLRVLSEEMGMDVSWNHRDEIVVLDENTIEDKIIIYVNSGYSFSLEQIIRDPENFFEATPLETEPIEAGYRVQNLDITFNSVGMNDHDANDYLYIENIHWMNDGQLNDHESWLKIEKHLEDLAIKVDKRENHTTVRYVMKGTGFYKSVVAIKYTNGVRTASIHWNLDQ